MIGLLLILLLAVGGGWLAWLYGVSPEADRDRIEADHAGTDARVVKVERVGTHYDRGALNWTADRAAVGPGKWFRLYNVTLARPRDFVEIQTVGVEVRLFGLPELKSFELRA